jgi:MFS family permease
MIAPTCRNCGGPTRVLADRRGRTTECLRCGRGRLAAWLGWALVGLGAVLGGAVAVASYSAQTDLHHTLFGPAAPPWAPSFFFAALVAVPAGAALILRDRQTRPPHRRWSPGNAPVPYLPRRAV